MTREHGEASGCINEDEFVAWTQWKRELHVFTANLEILSTSTCDYTIGDFAYNETTSDVFTCGRGAVTVSVISSLFYESDARQPEERLDFAIGALIISAQGAAPCPGISGDARSGCS